MSLLASPALAEGNAPRAFVVSVQHRAVYNDEVKAEEAQVGTEGLVPQIFGAYSAPSTAAGRPSIKRSLTRGAVFAIVLPPLIT